MADQKMLAASVSAAMANIYRLRPDKAQFSRFAETTRHFRARDLMMEGEEYHFKVLTSPYTGVRRTSTATGSESEFPPGRQVTHVDVKVAWTDLVEFQATVIFSGLAQKKTESLRNAVYRVADELVGGVDNDFAAQANIALHQDDTATMALIAAVYDEDGTAYTADQTDAYLQIDGGPIAAFLPGQILDAREGGNHADVQVTVKVNDVYPLSTGPGGTADIGPGITVTIADENAGDANLNGLADDDELCLSGEVTNLAGFKTWFSESANVFNITRSAKGSHWSVPNLFDFHSGGADVVLDVDDHLGDMAERLAYVVKYGRRERAKDGISVTNQMVAISTPKLVSEASRQGGDNMRMTIAIDEATRKRLFGRSGFEGYVFHSPTLGPIALQGDPVATPNLARLLEPDSWFWIVGHDGSQKTIEWLDKDGSRWHYERGTNGRMKNILQAGALMRLGLGNDQPKGNAQLDGLKSSLT
ncbi:MAG TPA: hypothetical protein VMW52_10975 [Phycisphaerae bacterium]|nr:hypothetical protein [Phycisphaerae bacterium]